MGIYRYAHIENGVVVNISLNDSESDFVFDCDVVQLHDEDKIGIGWLRQDNEWVRPEVKQEGPVDALGYHPDVQHHA